MSMSTTPDELPDELPAEKTNPREPWDICATCFAVVAGLDRHTAAVHRPEPETEEDTP